jgi:hypothetical protein
MSEHFAVKVAAARKPDLLVYVDPRISDPEFVCVAELEIVLVGLGIAPDSSQIRDFE